MVRLEKIEMNGFKSFVSSTEFTFGSGITAVVGPNGCGKSNIADAINWVIGERSSKTLRADHMGDVIFNGTENRRPVGMAEVTLVLSEPGLSAIAAEGAEGEADNGHEEGAAVEREPIRITRRLFRSGESEYLIGGEKRRLRDIQELLAGLGVGTGVYSIIEQGKIDRVITARPADRRVLIEEAAGIALYKIRKRQAQTKLESTEANLARIHDIVTELERQIGSLKRQAARARAYARITEGIDRSERVIFHHESVHLESSGAELGRRRQDGEAEESRAAAALGAAEAALQSAREAAARESLEHQRARDLLHELDRSIDALRTSVERAREQDASARAQIERSDREVAEVGARQQAAAEREALLALRREEAASGYREIEEALQRAETLLRLEASALQSDEGDLAVTREDLVSLASEVSSARSEIRRLQDLLARLESDAERLTRDREGIHADAASLAASRSRHEETLSESRAGLAHARREADAASRLLAMETSRSESLLVEREQKRGLLEGIGERMEALEEMEQSELAALAGAAAGPLRLLRDEILTSEDLDRAVDAALRGLLRGFVTSSRAQALSFLEDLKRDGRGRAVVIPEEATQSGGVPTEAPAGGAPTLADLLGPRISSIGPIRARLSRVLVARDLDEAARLRREAPEFDVVTRQGDLLSRDGWIEGGAELPEEAGVMTLKRLMERLSAESERSRTQLEELGGALERARARVAMLRAAAEEWRGRCEDLSRSVEGLEQRGEALAAEATRLKLREEAQAGESGRSREDLAVAREGMLAAEHRLTGGLHLEEETRRRAESLVGAVVDLRSALGCRQEDLALLRERAAAARVRQSSIEAEAEQHASAGLELDRRLAAQRAERESWVTRGQEAARRAEADALTLSDRMAERILAEGAVSSSRAAAEERRQQLEALEAELSRARAGLEAAREATHEIEIAEERLAGDRRHLDARVAERGWGDIAAATASLSTEEKARNASEVEAELAEWKARRDRMGPVNLMAMEQFRELEERHAFIAAQRKDLEDSIRSLRETIARINRQSRERFTTAFESIRTHFAEIYSILFHGGRADLRLAVEEGEDPDILEAGLEITAQPPGKRLQSIGLLSGGEKALTALSLLFAIFRYSPSPFCLLDEVDAALDELNVSRYVSLLKTMSEEIQFIVITHSRRTMEEAAMLYGVTMEEPGVSRAISVVMGSAEARREAVRSLPEELAARHRGNGRTTRIAPKSPPAPEA